MEVPGQSALYGTGSQAGREHKAGFPRTESMSSANGQPNCQRVEHSTSQSRRRKGLAQAQFTDFDSAMCLRTACIGTLKTTPSMDGLLSPGFAPQT